MKITRRRLFGSGAALLLTAGAAHARRAPHEQGQPHRAAPPLPLVLLDPGHGGKDPGAIGVSGGFEKHVAFAAAEDCRRILMKTGRYRVALTRNADHFIPLQQRVEIAQDHGAALFVSLHADAIADPAVRGASVYTLASQASDAQSEALARRENSADRFGDISFRDQPPEIGHILASLVQQETRVGSARMQRSVVDMLGQQLPLLEHPARHASFVVLKAADIPSVLVEMGFMSNPADEALLHSTAYRARVATAMARAVDGYFLNNHNAA